MRKSRYVPEQSAGTVAKWKAGVYIRLSHEDRLLKNCNSQSVLSQKKIAEKFLSEHPDIELQDFYIDDGCTGTNLHRPEFQRLQTAWENGMLNCVIIKDLSRLARNSEESSRLIYVIFPFYKIRFISILDRVDSFSDPKSVESIEIPVKNIMHDEYSRDLSKKIITASDIRRKNGEYLGAFAPYGYKKSSDNVHKLVIDEEAAETVRFIFSSFLEGVNRNQIAKSLTRRGVLTPSGYKKSKGCHLLLPRRGDDLGVWSPTSITQILKAPIYKGTAVQGKRRQVSYKDKRKISAEENKWIITENAHEAIIGEESFERVQKMLRDAPNPLVRTKEKSLFSGLVFCGYCKRQLSVSQNRGRGKYRAYYCAAAYRSDGVCVKQFVKLSALEDIVLTTLNQYAALTIDIEKTILLMNKAKRKDDRNPEQVQLLQREYAKLKTRKQDLYFRYKEGDLSAGEYADRKSAYEVQMNRLNQSIDALQASKEILYESQNNRFIQNFKSFRKFNELNRAIVEKFIKAIHVYGNSEFEVRLNFSDEFEEAIRFVQTNSENPNAKGKVASGY